MKLAMPETQADLTEISITCKLHELPLIHHWWHPQYRTKKTGHYLAYIGGRAPYPSGNKASNFKYENGKSPAQNLFFPGQPDDSVCTCLTANTRIDNTYCVHKMIFVCEKGDLGSFKTRIAMDSQNKYHLQ